MSDAAVDAVVVGGGPAGALSAIKLARLGWRTVLIERGLRHRNKTCGHCLNPRALSILRNEGLLDEVRAIATGVTRSLQVHLPGGVHMESPLTDADDLSGHDGLLVERNQLDQLLIDRAAAAGVEVLQPATAKVIDIIGRRVSIDVVVGSVRRSLNTGLIIGADGVGSAIARATGLASRVRAGRKYGFSFDFHRRAARGIATGGIHMFTGPGGYLGVVDQGGGAFHIAVLVDSREGITDRDPVAFTHRLAGQHTQLRSLGLHEIDRDAMNNFAAIGPMPWRPRRIANSISALVGDAAGYIEPFTGEGMSWALQSAQVLGEALQNQKPGEWNDAIATIYDWRWRRILGRKHRFCRMLAFALARPRLCEWVFSLGVQHPPLARRIIQQVVAT